MNTPVPIIPALKREVLDHAVVWDTEEPSINVARWLLMIPNEYREDLERVAILVFNQLGKCQRTEATLQAYRNALHEAAVTFVAENPRRRVFRNPPPMPPPPMRRASPDTPPPTAIEIPTDLPSDPELAYIDGFTRGFHRGVALTRIHDSSDHS